MKATRATTTSHVRALIPMTAGVVVGDCARAILIVYE